MTDQGSKAGARPSYSKPVVIGAVVFAVLVAASIGAMVYAIKGFDRGAETLDGSYVLAFLGGLLGFFVCVGLAIAAIFAGLATGGGRLLKQSREASAQLASWARARGLACERRGGFGTFMWGAMGGGRRTTMLARASGQLPGGLDGAVEIHLGDGAEVDKVGRTDDDTTPYTAVATGLQLPPKITGLTVAPRDGDPISAWLAERLGRWDRIELESTVLDSRFVVLAKAGSDPGAIRELLSPVMVDWLASEVPNNFAFEISPESLRISVPQLIFDDAYLDSLCQSSAWLAGRARAEALEVG